MTTETLAAETMAEAQARLSKMGVGGGETITPAVWKAEIIGAKLDITRKRAVRSDKGVPRESFYVSIPGVRFDMKEHEGFVAFGLWLDAQTEPLGHPTSLAIGEIIRQLLSEIDRLRAK